MRLLLLLVVLALGCACSRPSPSAGAAGATGAAAPTAAPASGCERAQFQQAIDAFDTLARQRNEAVLQIEAYPVDEYYVQNLETDLRAFESLVRQSGAVDVPACLEAARDQFRASMAQTQAALNVRRPGEAREAYVEARKAARATYEEFNAEVQRQVPNVR
jgi:thiol:disulfide interchange protein